MSILSGFKRFERYMPTEDGLNWQMVSQKTLAKDVILDNGTNAEDNITIINTALPFKIVINDTEQTINFIDR